MIYQASFSNVKLRGKTTVMHRIYTQGAIFPNAKLVKSKVNLSINVFGKNLPHVKKRNFLKFSPPFSLHRSLFPISLFVLGEKF